MDILQTIQSSLSPAQINTVASRIGESPEATGKAMAGALPAVLGGVVHEGATTQGAASLIDTMKRLPLVGGLGDMLSNRDDSLSRTGSSMLGEMFGNQVSGIADRIAGFAGIKSSSAQGLLAMVAPMVLGGVAKAAPAGGFTPQALIGELQSQKPSIARALPAGLSGLTGVLGLSGLASGAQDTARAGARAVRGGMNWLPWAIGALVAAFIVFYGVSTCSNTHVGFGTLSLPGGGTISVREGSIGSQLYNFLSGSGTTPKTFTFDNLEFASGEANYTSGSQPTIDAIAAILKAYPNAAVRIEGHTDTTGDAAQNLSLSKARAESVAQALVAQGVGTGRISSQGFGSTRPIADNSTGAGRAQNRRIELVVTRR